MPSSVPQQLLHTAFVEMQCPDEAVNRVYGECVPLPPQELWLMLHSASNTPSGVPQQLLDAKEAELRERRLEEERRQVGIGAALCLMRLHGSRCGALLLQ